MKFVVVLKHVCGERKELPVEFVSPTLTYISVRWGQSGIYDLNLVKNVLTARSQRAQRKGKAHWTAENIELVRSEAKEYLASRAGNPKQEVLKAVVQHERSMPIVKKLNPRIEPYPHYSGDPDLDELA